MQNALATGAHTFEHFDIQAKLIICADFPVIEAFIGRGTCRPIYIENVLY